MESSNDDRGGRDTPDRLADDSGRGSERERADGTRRPDQERRHHQMTDDERVDEAGEESFPASDPPAV